MSDSVKKYLKDIEAALKIGKTTEHTHRPALKFLIESLEPKISAINEPGRIECGAPDFLISRSPGPPTVGYVEAKDVDKSLDDAEKSEQLKRYRRSLENLVLTDYLEFRWYGGGEHRTTARLARIGKGGGLILQKDGGKAVIALLKDFLSHTPKPISTPQELAERMARLTHLIRDIIVETFEKGKASISLSDLRKAFATVLIPDLDQPEKSGEFSDMYAQTIAYGLFAARCNHKIDKPFQRLGAASEIPKTNPFLRKLFEIITGTDLDNEPYAGFVDDLVQLLAHADIGTILEHFGKRTRQEDPVLHFYETFLATYDPAQREMRGVYYTPEPVVSYIVRSVDHLLRTRFSLADGLADTATIQYEREKDGEKPKKVKVTAPRVLLLDPACGSGTFAYAVVDLIRSRFIERGNAGMWAGFVKNHLLPRLFGFELLMAPYAVAHFKMGMQLAGQDLSEAKRKLWAYDFSGDERLGIYLTNTLEEAERRIRDLFGPLRIITEEASAAAGVKRDMPLLVVMGNPPYSGHSANRSWEVKEGKRVPTFIGKLLQDYYYVDGQPLKERTAKWLQDDYVKFIRWGQGRIERTGAGILAFITNHGYLDNPTFRGMRRALMNAFTDIFILNLHGNTKKKERAPDGSKDENVFDIQQGVAIGIFVKEFDKTGPADVRHADLWGLRETKYQGLLESNIDTTSWSRLSPQPPYYLFVPQESELLAEYEQGWPLPDIIPLNGAGMTTARDHVVIDFEADVIIERARIFRDSALSDVEVCRQLDIPLKKGWDVAKARKSINQVKDISAHIKTVLYRPFDIRSIFYHDSLVWRTVRQVMGHMLAGRNIGIITTRQTRDKWDAFVTQHICGHKTCAAYDINYLFPLYIYSIVDEHRDDQKRLFQASPWPPGKDGRVPNLNPKFVDRIEQRLGMTFTRDGAGDLEKSFGPEDVLRYVYAILYSPTYRSRYAEFLRRDFPRIPLTSERDLFQRLCSLGKDVVAFHLLESPLVSKPITRYPIPGDNLVEKGYPKFLATGAAEPGTGMPLPHDRVYINKKQYFEGVSLNVWEFNVGGFQVCEKWLKDRQGRPLSYEDLTHYQKIIVALKETIRLMGEIDGAIPAWPIVGSPGSGTKDLRSESSQ